MIERKLFDVLVRGIAWFSEKPERFARFLIEEHGLSEEEAAIARTYFGGDPEMDPPEPAHPPTIIHGYARQGGPFPCVALTLGAEDVATDYLGHDASTLDEDGEPYLDPETGDELDPKVRRMRYTFNLMIHADHPDVAIWYYHLIKHLVVSSCEELEQEDIEDITISGRDLAPEPRYLPDTIFTRLLAVTCEGDETWDNRRQERPGRGASVGGIFAPEQTTGVTGKVTPYTE